MKLILGLHLSLRFYLDIMKFDPSWNPHQCLEFTKVMKKTHMVEFSLKYGKHVEDKHCCIVSELTILRNVKQRIIEGNTIKDGLPPIDIVESEKFQLEQELDVVLTKKD